MSQAARATTAVVPAQSTRPTDPGTRGHPRTFHDQVPPLDDVARVHGASSTVTGTAEPTATAA